MNHYRITIRDRRGGSIEPVADFIMLANSDKDARIIVESAYPNIIDYHVRQITFPDYTR